MHYEIDPSPGDWNGNVVFVADNADEAGDFAADADLLASTFIVTPFTPYPIYYAPPFTSVIDTQQTILTRWNAGAGIVLFNGHSSVRQWAGERLFHRDDVATLDNGGRLPVVLEMTCLTGLFHEAGGTTLDETLLREAHGGAVAVWGATGLGVATGHMQLARGFLASAFQRLDATVGVGTLAGKLALVASGSGAMDLLDTFTLLARPSHEAEPDTRLLDQHRVFADRPALAPAGGRVIDNAKEASDGFRRRVHHPLESTGIAAQMSRSPTDDAIRTCAEAAKTRPVAHWSLTPRSMSNGYALTLDSSSVNMCGDFPCAGKLSWRCVLSPIGSFCATSGYGEDLRGSGWLWRKQQWRVPPSSGIWVCRQVSRSPVFRLAL